MLGCIMLLNVAKRTLRDKEASRETSEAYGNSVYVMR